MKNHLVQLFSHVYEEKGSLRLNYSYEYVKITKTYCFLEGSDHVLC